MYTATLLDLQASHSESSKPKIVFLSWLSTYQLSSVHAGTHNSSNHSLLKAKGGPNQTEKRKKTNLYMYSSLFFFFLFEVVIYTQNSKPKTQNCGLYHALCTSSEHEKNACRCRSVVVFVLGHQMWRALVLLNQGWQIHICYVDVNHQLCNVIDGERYTATRNRKWIRSSGDRDGSQGNKGEKCTVPEIVI